METEGIFRLSGAASAVQALKQRLDTATAFAPDMSDWPRLVQGLSVDGHAVAGVLKLYLRELPDPLLTRHLYDCWLAAQGKSKTYWDLKAHL
jgi:hypothetical protein